MMEKNAERSKVEYEKPQVLDLGTINPIYGLCSYGSSDSGNCNEGDFAGTCDSAGNSASTL